MHLITPSALLKTTVEGMGRLTTLHVPSPQKAIGSLESALQGARIAPQKAFCSIGQARPGRQL